MDSDLAENRLDVDLHGGFGDVDLACDDLIGVAFNQAVQYASLPDRQSRRILVFNPQQFSSRVFDRSRD